MKKRELTQHRTSLYCDGDGTIIPMERATCSSLCEGMFGDGHSAVSKSLCDAKRSEACEMAATSPNAASNGDVAWVRLGTGVAED